MDKVLTIFDNNEKVANYFAAQSTYKGLILYILEGCDPEVPISSLDKHFHSYQGVCDSYFKLIEILGILSDWEAVSMNFIDTVEMWSITEAGRDILELYKPSREIECLLKSDLGDVYKRIMKACNSPADTEELVLNLGREEILVKKNLTVYYLLECLENTGAIVWDNRGWILTSSGRECMV